MLETENKQNEIKPELRERIIVAALKSFTMNGIKSVTMDHIASDLGISKRTLYEMFEDKETLLSACVQLQIDEKEKFEAKILSETDNVLLVILAIYKTYIEAIYKIDKRFFEDIGKYPKVNKLLRDKREINKSKAIDFFKKGTEQGLFRDDIDFEILYLLLHKQVEFLINSDMLKSYSLVEVYELIMFTFLRGISTNRGQQILEEFISEYRKQNINQSGQI
jgi:AcrR family transcriptional regulator